MAKKINPWAVCHSQLGKKKTDKFERCVMKIKSKHGIKDWTEFKAALRYLSETVQGQEDDIRVARERQEKEARKAEANKLPASRRREAALRGGSKPPLDLMQSEMGESVSFKEKLKYMKEAIKSATSTGLVRGRIGKHPKGDEEEHEMRRQKGILAHTESEGPSLREKIKYLKEVTGKEGKTAGEHSARHPLGQGGTWKAGKGAGPGGPLSHFTGTQYDPATGKTHGEGPLSLSKAGMVARKHPPKGHAALQPIKKKVAKKKSVVSHTKHEGPSLAETKDWIQGAVNPKHKGYCTPMTKKTCTPARKALAKRFKKAGRQEGTKKGGKTGWKGKV